MNEPLTEEMEVEDEFGIEETELDTKDVLTMPAEQYAINYLLQDEAFAEWYFRRNRWDAVEQGYDIEQKKRNQQHRTPVRFDLSTLRNAQPTRKTKFVDTILQAVRDRPGLTFDELTRKIHDEPTRSKMERIRNTIWRDAHMFRIESVLRDNSGGRMFRIYPKD